MQPEISGVTWFIVPFGLEVFWPRPRIISLRLLLDHLPWSRHVAFGVEAKKLRQEHRDWGVRTTLRGWGSAHMSFRCSYHFFLLCQLTTLTIHNSISLSLSAQDLPLPQIFPPIDSLPASGLTPRTSRLDRFFWASPFYVFSFFVILFCLASVRQTKLATRQLLGAR